MLHWESYLLAEAMLVSQGPFRLSGSSDCAVSSTVSCDGENFKSSSPVQESQP